MDYIYDPVTNSFEGTTQNTISLGQVMWHITNKCSLNCLLCFTRKMRSDDTELAYDDIPMYVSILKKIGVQKIDLSGGEPLLYSQLPFLVRECTANSIAVTITTSGIGIQQNIDWLTENWRLFSRVIVSLDGPEIIHNELRRSNCAYAGAQNLFRLMNLKGCENLRINTVLTKKIISTSVCDNLNKIITAIKPLEWCIIEPFPINKTEFYDALMIQREEYEAFYKRSVFLMEKRDIKVIRRANDDYGAYWALYPDGFLYYSHNNRTYDTKILLNGENYFRICELVTENKQHYIKIMEAEK